jgi:hypothetical protein
MEVVSQEHRGYLYPHTGRSAENRTVYFYYWFILEPEAYRRVCVRFAFDRWLARMIFSLGGDSKGRPDPRRFAAVEILMSLDMPAYLEARRKFLANRAAFPVEDLAKYAGLWIAWSPDGTRVAASAVGPELLDNILTANGENPDLCVVEGIPDDNGIIGGPDGGAT